MSEGRCDICGKERTVLKINNAARDLYCLTCLNTHISNEGVRINRLTRELTTLREALRLMSEAEAVEHECYLAPPDHGLKKPMDDKCIDCDRHEKEIAICLYNHFIAQAKGVE